MGQLTIIEKTHEEFFPKLKWKTVLDRSEMPEMREEDEDKQN